MGNDENINESVVPPLQESILNTIKKMIGVEENYKQFDIDLIVHINTAFAALAQIGHNLKDGYFISDMNNIWSEYITDTRLLDPIKTYVYLKTKLVFDPPSSSMVIESMKQTLKELEFRIQISAESIDKEDKNVSVR